jgi:hypothetical protein
MCGYAKISGDTGILATSQARLFNPTQLVAWVRGWKFGNFLQRTIQFLIIDKCHRHDSLCLQQSKFRKGIKIIIDANFKTDYKLVYMRDI